jgi:hypothetical protein
MDVELSAYSIGAGDPLTLTIRGFEDASSATVLGLQIFGVGVAETYFRMGTSLSVIPKDGEIEAMLERTDSLGAGSICEIKRLELSGPQGVIALLVGGRDFNRTFFRVHAEANEAPPVTAADVAAVASEIESKREDYFAQPLGDPSRLTSKRLGSPRITTACTTI